MIDKYKFILDIVAESKALKRAFQILLSYFLNAAILIACIFIIGKLVPPETLRSFLVYFLVASTAAGLDPGTSKASLTHAGSAAPFEGGTALLLASSVKALLISPGLMLVWAVSSGNIVSVSELTLVPIITILGFAATDMRVALDAQGRYALAIWGKQGSLALAALVPAIALVMDQKLTCGIAAACLARALWIAAFWLITKDDGARSISTFDHLLSRPWKHLMASSCLGALSASIDRIAAFRLLDAASSNTYVLAYEILTKFWVINYLLAPIVFAQTVKFGKNNSFSKYAYLIIGITSVPFLFFTLIFFLSPLSEFFSSLHGNVSVSLFAISIVLTAFCGILLMEVQALNSAKAATQSAAAGLIIALLAFPAFFTLWGINGLFAAWLAKSSIEFLLLFKARQKLNNA